MAWRKQTPAEVEALFAANRAADPFGRRLHTVLAAGAIFLAAWPTTWVDWAGLPLAVCCAIRLISHHRILGPLVWDPIIRLCLAWAAWLSLSVLWSPAGAGTFAQQVGPLHFAVWPLMLWPVLDRRPIFVAALIAGFLCGQFSQVLQVVGTHWHIPAITWNRFPDRNSGWWDPVVGGSLLTAALGLHLGALLGPAAPHRFRLLASLFSLLTLLSIAATGTRGAWIASAMLLAIAAGVLLWRRLKASLFAAGEPEDDSNEPEFRGVGEAPRARPALPRRRGLAARFAASVLLALLLVSGVVFLLPSVSHRAAEGVAEVKRAWNTNDYSTFTGQRIAMWRDAWHAFCSHPIQGVGAGGFRAWVAQHEPVPIAHSHAHSWPLHTLATTGIVGFLVLAALVIIAVRSGLKREHSAGAASPAPVWKFGNLEIWQFAPAFALIGLTLAGLFDTIHVNQQTANLLFILLAMCLPRRPRAVM